jgi:hypothetical protein
MNKSFVSKTWWHWNENRDDLWENFWEDKYTNKTSKVDLIILNEVGPGSLICNNA